MGGAIITPFRVLVCTLGQGGRVGFLVSRNYWMCPHKHHNTDGHVLLPPVQPDPYYIDVLLANVESCAVAMGNDMANRNAPS